MNKYEILCKNLGVIENPNIKSMLIKKLFEAKEKLDDEKRVMVEGVSELSSGVGLGFHDYFDKFKKAHEKYGYECQECKIKTVTRLTVDRGAFLGHVPLEVGLAFDPYENVPVIFASSIRGAVRALVDKRFRDGIFGTAGEPGKVVFSDAFPIEKERLLLVPDVMTPHYPGAKTELEVRPRPIIFLTVDEGVTFKFLCCHRNLTDEERRELNAALVRMVEEGIGAKTSLGYSRFEVVEDGQR